MLTDNSSGFINYSGGNSISTGATPVSQGSSNVWSFLGSTGLGYSNDPSGDTWRGFGADWFNAPDIADEDWKRGEQSAQNEWIRGLLSSEYANQFTAAQAQLDRFFNSEEAAKSRDWQSNEAAISREFNSSEAQKQRDFERFMAETQYQRAIADLKAAGLNPILAFANSNAVPSGATASSSVPSGATASSSGSHLGAVGSSGRNNGNRGIVADTAAFLEFIGSIIATAAGFYGSLKGLPVKVSGFGR